MTNFTTTITSLYTLNTPDPEYVVNAIWQVTGVDGNNTASIAGNTVHPLRPTDRSHRHRLDSSQRY